jgi:hypothetical protein
LKTVKTTAKTKKSAGKIETPVKQQSKYVYHIAIASAGVVLLGTAIYFFGIAPEKKALQGATIQKEESQSPMRFIYGTEDKPVDQAQRTGSNKVNIRAIRFIPDQPTAAEPIKAEVVYDYTGTAEVTFEYEWKINGKVIENAGGNELRSSALKKKDEIGVTVVPLLDGVRSEPFESSVVIHTIAPTLEMKVLSSGLKRGSPVEIQLTGQSSNGEKLVYALEEPFLEGMTINKDSGKIACFAEKPQKGVYRFGASVTDADGNKVVKIFEYQLGSAELK